jgi:hypothetical protein
VADYLPVEANKASKIQRLERFLKNPGILVIEIYTRIVKVMLEKWNGRNLDIAIDRTDWKIFNLLLCGIAYNNRVLPLGWRLLNHAGNSDFDEQKELLDSIGPILPEKCHISLLGDGDEICLNQWLGFQSGTIQKHMDEVPIRKMGTA